jgi:hypothetical protein
VYLDEYREQIQRRQKEEEELMIDEFLIDFDPNLVVQIEADSENDDLVKISFFSVDDTSDDNDDDDEEEDDDG